MLVGSLQTSSQSRIASMFVRSQPTCSPSSVTAVCDRLLHSEHFRHPKDGLIRRGLITFLTLPCCHSSQRDFANAHQQKRGTMPMQCASSAVESYSISRWHSASALFPQDSQKMSSARLMTASDGNKSHSQLTIGQSKSGQSACEHINSIAKITFLSLGKRFIS